MKNNIIPQSEFALQCQVVEYLELLILQKKVVCFSAIPSSTFTRSWGVKMKNKQSGVRSGVPDLLIVFPHTILFLELKREITGVLSASQKAWRDALTHAGIPSKVASGWEEARSCIDTISHS